MPIKRVHLDNNLPKDCFDSWNAPVKIRISSATCPTDQPCVCAPQQSTAGCRRLDDRLSLRRHQRVTIAALPLPQQPLLPNSVIGRCCYIEIINNKARHNLMDAKCRLRSDGAVSFKEPLGQTKVMQIRQGETLNHQGAITHEVCCLAATQYHSRGHYQCTASQDDTAQIVAASERRNVPEYPMSRLLC